jgi:hypothetical protein
MRSRDSVVFTALVGTVLFVGAGLMGLVLLAAGAPGALAIGVILAAISALADQIGVGAPTSSFGWKQLLGLVLGIILVVAGIILLRQGDAEYEDDEELAALMMPPVTPNPNGSSPAPLLGMGALGHVLIVCWYVCNNLFCEGSGLLAMMKDPYGNYVLQKLLEVLPR